MRELDALKRTDLTDPREPYDLATAGADYPAWSGLPHRTVIICSHPRSGSTLLGEAVHAAGGLGCPLEYLHRGFRPSLAERWDAHDLNAFVRAMHRHRTDPSGVFSIKLFWRDVEEVVAEATGEQAESAIRLDEMLDRLNAILPDPTFVYLTRRDRVRQAVSAFIASETSSFRALPAPLAPVDREVPYDYEGILRQLAVADYSNARWEAFFSATGIAPYRVEYEQLATHYDCTAGAVLAHLGRRVRPAPPRLRRQATAQSERFVLRFLTDHERSAKLAESI